MPPDRKPELSQSNYSFYLLTDEAGGINMEEAGAITFTALGLSFLGAALHDKLTDGEPTGWLIGGAVALISGGMAAVRGFNRRESERTIIELRPREGNRSNRHQ